MEWNENHKVSYLPTLPRAAHISSYSISAWMAARGAHPRVMQTRLSWGRDAGESAETCGCKLQASRGLWSCGSSPTDIARPDDDCE